jgi:hypothetical protein
LPLFLQNPQKSGNFLKINMLLCGFLDMKFKDRALGFLPAEVKAGVDELIRATKAYERDRQ